MRFRVLGPLEVTTDDGPVSLGGPKQRVVLAHLIVRANQMVPANALIDQVWGEEPPDSARSVLQTYVSRLRKILGPERIEGREPGYVLHLQPFELDTAQFESLLDEARAASDQPDRAGGLLKEALVLWNGPAFADLAAEESLSGEITRLNDLRLQALEDRIDADIAGGRHAEVLGELGTLTHEHILRERLWGHLMLALYRSGRQTDALAAYQRLRRVLADELGVDPSPDLQRLHERILHQDPDLELKGEPLRGYRLLEQIGEGAYGVVYRATQPQIGREVAIKAVHPDLANHPDFVRRFEREAQLVARLEHPHIVPLYDYWREPDGAFLVMRFLRGGNLEDLIAEGPLSVEQAAAILDQTSAALAAAHRQGVVHRDVKPGNVLLDEEGNAYLTDFGVALDAGSPERTSGTMMRGTPAYLSPEQIRLDPATPQSDVYALGIVLYEMLTGDHPFPETSLTTLLDRHLSDALPSVREARPDLTPGVEATIARATAKDVGDRFGDPLEVAAAFRAAVEGAAPARVPSGETRNPYKGLRAFLEADADDFFGRENLTERLVRRLGQDEPGSRFLTLVGPSGSGKSSAVRAGLVPALRHGALHGSERWYVIEMLPGLHPFRELESALLGVAVDPPASLMEYLERDELGLVDAVDRVLPDPGAELLIVLDQLEELFTLVGDEGERARFLESIRASALAPGSRVRVVATLRADFYDQPLSVSGFGDLLAARNEAITPMSPEELERAIVAPADRAGFVVEPMLFAAMIADVSDRPGALPLMQYALTELAERAHGNVLTIDAYRDIGRVQGALAGRAEHLFEAMNETGHTACRQLFLRLVTLGEGSEDTRRRVRRSELTPLADAQTMESVIEAFGRHRLLSFDRDPATREPTVEIAHEALVGAWLRLRGWIDEARDDIRAERQLANAADEWETSERDPSFLLRGARLEQTASWAETATLALSEEDRTFLEASVHQRDEEFAAEGSRLAKERELERRSVRRLRGVVAALTAAALVAGVLTVVANNQSGKAEREARIAQARELASAAIANLDVDPELSILLALQAVETTRRDATVLPEAVEAIHRAVAVDRLLFTIRHRSTGNIAYGPDGRLLATGGSIVGNEHTDVLLWDARTGDLVHTLSGHDEDVYSVAFSSDGSRMVSTGDDDRTIVWDTRSGERLLTVPGEQGEAAGASFSPDGHLLAIGNLTRGGTIRVVDAQSGQEVRTPIEASGDSCSPTFSPNAARIAASSCPLNDYAHTGVWDVGTGRRLPQFDNVGGHPVYSPDGRRLATVLGSTITIRDAESGRHPMTMNGQTGFIIGLAFSADGSRLASAGTDGTVQVWDATTGLQELALVGHAGIVGDVDFSPDGSRLLTGGGDTTARVWDVSRAGGSESFTGVESDELNSVEYGSDGSTLLTTGWDGGWLWDASTGERVQNYPDLVFDGTLLSGESQIVGGEWSDETDDVVARVLGSASGDELRTLLKSRLSGSIAASPDGSQIAIGTDTGIAVLRDARSGELLRRLGEASNESNVSLADLAYNPDSRLLAGMTANGTLHLWNVTTGEELVSRQAHTGLASAFASGLAFSPDGALLATSGGDGAAIWRAPSGELVTRLTGPGGVNGVAFSQDGSELATAGGDGAARIWDVRTWRLTLTIGGRAPSLRGVAFSPDGTELATVGVDGLLRAYVLDISALERLARERVTRGFTEQECRQYLHVSSCPRSVGTPALSPTAPASEELPPLDGPEGAYRVTVSPDDLRFHELPAKDAGDYTLSLVNGDWRLHADLRNSDAIVYSGTYTVLGDSITFTDRSDVWCFEKTWSSRWSLDGNSLSFADTSSTTNPSCDRPDIAGAWVQVTDASLPWQRVSHHEYS
jgi:WD40 repeat protein/serine/threonine protein kinase